MRRLTILLAAVGALMLVPTAQAFAEYEGHVTIAGSGEGEVSSVGGEIFGNNGEGSPPIECHAPAPGEGTCDNALADAGFFKGVSLHVVTPAGSEFTGWTVVDGNVGGGCSGTETECIGIADGEGTTEVEVTATFEPCEEGSEAESCEEAATEFPLTLSINEGEGTVVSDPAGITCTGSEGEECSAEFEESAEVTLTASPAAGYRHFRWDNCPSGNLGTRQCTVTMDAAKEVGVKFRKAWNLDLSKSGDGVGTIKNTSNGLTCATTCSAANQFIFEGQEITLYANAPGKNQFVEFTGGTGPAAACDGEAECTYTVEADASTEAVINKYAQATLSLEKAGGGEAKLTGGLYCNNSCTSISGDFYTGPSPEEVTINWDLKNGTNSIDFGAGAGSCTGSSSEDTGSCSVTMSESHELTATLE